ncbi:hypothetical protein AK812_SmicGene41269 [Symbiodinium microadriaticum]|uniref:Uncharacterized protein n=1 Tax=Symbiodinium microadriaticum TaxID=2951 RepID=A0A1Q9C6J8_SYMMI|nr:hypothetical protein AK812_SmicGene41269 [Symbiodinium microadriaticum]
MRKRSLPVPKARRPVTLYINFNPFDKHFRYVDNRLTLIPTCATHLSHFSQFLSPHFYGTPMFVETEPGLDFLGFTIHPSQHTIHYKATSNLTDILSPQSASPDIVLRSNFRARAISAQRLATPREAVAHTMEQLSEVYRTAGYDQSWIQHLCKEQDPPVENYDNVHQDDDTKGVPSPKTPPHPPPLTDDPDEHEQPFTCALTEAEERTEDSQSRVSSLSDPEFRDQLADFIEMSNKDINDLKERVSRLEAPISK